jgi:hypothetical protein
MTDGRNQMGKGRIEFAWPLKVGAGDTVIS